MKCPYCGYDNLLIKKKWKYAIFNVKNAHCPECKKKFKLYFYENGKLSHTIPKVE
jgi:Zn ribbon nucleic-acid-binding protein